MFGAHERRFGALAQLGERLLCKQEVIGSIPIGSTSLRPAGSGVHTLLFKDIPRDEDTSFVPCFGDARIWGNCPLFDIVNGFLKSMPWQYWFLLI